MSIIAEPRTATGTSTRILVADPIAEDGVARLRAAGEVDVAVGLDPAALRERIAQYDALVVRSETKVTAEVLDAAPRLRVVGRAGVGVDNIDIAAATQRGMVVMNTPSGNTIAAAEHAIAMMLALARNIPAADARYAPAGGSGTNSWASSCAARRSASSASAGSAARSPAAPARGWTCACSRTTRSSQRSGRSRPASRSATSRRC